MGVKEIIKAYDKSNLSIVSLGGHIALDASLGAKKQGFKTIVVARADRALPYSRYLKSDGSDGCVDETIVVDNYSDILKEELQEKLRTENGILTHSRYFWVYFNFADIENKLEVPFFGTRELLRLEERDQKPNQYDLLKEAGIRTPRFFASPKNIDCLTITKVGNSVRGYERENFFASNVSEWEKIAEEKIKSGVVKKESLEKPMIEEFILGAQVNFNFFYSPLKNRLELLGTDTRRQTSLDGWLRLPASEQLKIASSPLHIEAGHIAVTVKESLLARAYEAGEKFVEACKKYHPRGIIGPFALQGAIATDGAKEEIVIFDVSFRMPGSPGITATPYSAYLFGRSISMGERSAMEIKDALKLGRLEDILS